MTFHSGFTALTPIYAPASSGSTIGASVYSSLNPGAYTFDFKVANNGRFATGIVGSGYLLDVGTLILRDGDGGSGSGTNSGILQVQNGGPATPTLSFAVETGLGFYRSGASRLGLSYGQLSLADGSNTTPSIGLSSASSVGFYSSGVQTIAQSLGTLNLATNSVRLSMRTIAASALTASAANTNVAVDRKSVV